LLHPHHLPIAFRGEQTNTQPTGKPRRIASVEEDLIRKALDQTEGNRALAAQWLGINPSTLYRKLKKLGIDGPERDGRGNRRRTHS
jgi:DNA-binding NtrC family response regulator